MATDTSSPQRPSLAAEMLAMSPHKRSGVALGGAASDDGIGGDLKGGCGNVSSSSSGVDRGVETSRGGGRSMLRRQGSRTGPSAVGVAPIKERVADAGKRPLQSPTIRGLTRPMLSPTMRGLTRPLGRLPFMGGGGLLRGSTLGAVGGSGGGGALKRRRGDAASVSTGVTAVRTRTSGRDASGAGRAVPLAPIGRPYDNVGRQGNATSDLSRGLVTAAVTSVGAGTGVASASAATIVGASSSVCAVEEENDCVNGVVVDADADHVEEHDDVPTSLPNELYFGQGAEEWGNQEEAVLDDVEQVSHVVDGAATVNVDTADAVTSGDVVSLPNDAAAPGAVDAPLGTDQPVALVRPALPIVDDTLVYIDSDEDEPAAAPAVSQPPRPVVAPLQEAATASEHSDCVVAEDKECDELFGGGLKIGMPEGSPLLLPSPAMPAVTVVEASDVTTEVVGTGCVKTADSAGDVAMESADTGSAVVVAETCDIKRSRRSVVSAKVSTTNEADAGPSSIVPAGALDAPYSGPSSIVLANDVGALYTAPSNIVLAFDPSSAYVAPSSVVLAGPAKTGPSSLVLSSAVGANVANANATSARGSMANGDSNTGDGSSLAVRASPQLVTRTVSSVAVAPLPSSLPSEEVHALLERTCGPGARIDEDAARVVSRMADFFVDDVLRAASCVARHRGARVLEASDMRLVLEMEWGLKLN
eukprot:TRINITY_DN13067_c0_g1_i2.p1 TRINITY_DN13067_c0_g1~~TRINITY_DN13067_c0_g1_i2.p1  ORF type:complete len:713 (-),score=149.11 TRINITY_DN13067_c0_g1_i2:17-2119(-)